jgi:hypothetical protein
LDSPFLTGTYLACLSEHQDEDEHGRLPMWRAYGATTGIALVINAAPVIGPTQFPVAPGRAFQALLEETGVKGADRRISISSIPLRR